MPLTPAEVAKKLAEMRGQPIVSQTKKVLPGITAVVILPHETPRSLGGLARLADGPSIRIRVNELDRAAIVLGAKKTGLKIADYVRQCAVNVANAIKAQENAQSDPVPPAQPSKEGTEA